jgi:FKBP-type peptidyl-prolyl cis-trans isomerase FkpA
VLVRAIVLRVFILKLILMKFLFFMIPAVLLFTACEKDGSLKEVPLTTFEDSLSYAFGSLTGDDLKGRGVSLNGEIFGQAVEAEANGTATMTEDAMFACFGSFSKELQTAGGKYAEGAKPTVNIDTLSYAIGKNLGSQLKEGGVKINSAAAVMGLNQAYAATEAKPAKMDKAACEKIMQTYSLKERQKQMDANTAAVQPNVEAGKAFLAENATKEGVKTTASGLQYKVLTEGKGKKPAATDKVKVHYEGRLLDGTVFDSSYKRGEPISFPLSGVIPGWTEGVQLMGTGSKYQFYIPQELAYGLQGSPPTISGGSTLIFDVELLGIE